MFKIYRFFFIIFLLMPFHYVVSMDLHQNLNSTSDLEKYLKDMHIKLTPLEKALHDENLKQFIELLLKKNCTNTEFGNILQSTWNLDLFFEYFKVIVSSNTLCSSNCMHKKSSSSYFNYKNLKQAIDQRLKNYIRAYSNPEIRNLGAHKLLGHFPCIALGILTAHSKNLLLTRFKWFLDNNTPLEELSSFAQWICNSNMVHNETKNHLNFIFISPACSEIFRKYVYNESFELKDILQLKNSDFEYACVTRNTDAIIKLFGILSRSSDNETSKTILLNLEKAVEKHREIWPPYAQEVTEIITTIKNMYTLNLQYRYALLKKKKFKDVHFKF